MNKINNEEVPEDDAYKAVNYELFTINTDTSTNKKASLLNIVTTVLKSNIKEVFIVNGSISSAKSILEFNNYCSSKAIYIDIRKLTDAKKADSNITVDVKKVLLYLYKLIRNNARNNLSIHVLNTSFIKKNLKVIREFKNSQKDDSNISTTIDKNQVFLTTLRYSKNKSSYTYTESGFAIDNNKQYDKEQVQDSIIVYSTKDSLELLKSIFHVVNYYNFINKFTHKEVLCVIVKKDSKELAKTGCEEVYSTEEFIHKYNNVFAYYNILYKLHKNYIHLSNFCISITSHYKLSALEFIDAIYNNSVRFPYRVRNVMIPKFNNIDYSNVPNFEAIKNLLYNTDLSTLDGSVVYKYFKLKF